MEEKTNWDKSRTYHRGLGWKVGAFPHLRNMAPGSLVRLASAPCLGLLCSCNTASSKAWSPLSGTRTRGLEKKLHKGVTGQPMRGAADQPGQRRCQPNQNQKGLACGDQVWRGTQGLAPRSKKPALPREPQLIRLCLSRASSAFTGEPSAQLIAT